MAGLFVQFDLHHTCHKRRRRYRRAAVLHGFECIDASAHGTGTDLGERDFFPGCQTFHTVSGKFQFSTVTVQDLCSFLHDPLL